MRGLGDVPAGIAFGFMVLVGLIHLTMASEATRIFGAGELVVALAGLLWLGVRARRRRPPKEPRQ